MFSHLQKRLTLPRTRKLTAGMTPWQSAASRQCPVGARCSPKHQLGFQEAVAFEIPATSMQCSLSDPCLAHVASTLQLRIACPAPICAHSWEGSLWVSQHSTLPRVCKHLAAWHLLLAHFTTRPLAHEVCLQHLLQSSDRLQKALMPVRLARAIDRKP
jgi:hypothetical protein